MARRGRLASLVLLVCMMFASLPALAQQKQKFSVTSFELDQSSTTSERHDYDGYPMALIKVTSNDPESLSEYIFNFGNQSCEKDSRSHGDEIWLFVQRNAKRVNISHGNASIEIDLRPMVEAGKVYHMYIKGPEPVMRFQMCRFEISPKVSGALVFVKGSGSDASEERLGMTDASGSVAKNLRHDRYTYRVIADQYKESQGEFVLNDENNTHIERVALRSNFAEVTLSVDADADIYINNEKRGRRTWTGRLNAGDYQIECRQENHRASRKLITVVENDNRTFTLDKPTPITGKLSVNSTPLDATITIDGRDYGTTPRNLDVIIGRHTVKLSKPNHRSVEKTVEVKEGQTVEVNERMSSMARITISSRPSDAVLYIDGKMVGTTPYTAEMASGDYMLKVSKYKYTPYEKRVHLDASNPNVTIPLSRLYFKPTGAYMLAGFQAGGLMGPTAALGAYFANVNVEAFVCYGLNRETVYGVHEGSYIYSDEEELTPLAIGGRLGYGIVVGNRCRLTPQVGFSVVKSTGRDVQISAGCLGFSLRAEYALSSNFSVLVSPQYRVAVGQGEVFKSLTASSVIKGWGQGFDVTAGFSLNF